MREFIAVEPGDEVLNNILRVQGELPPMGLKLVKKENLHITLRFLGEIDKEMEKNVIEGIKNCANLSFPVLYKGVGAFPSTNYARVIWVGAKSEGLELLYSDLSKELRKFKFKEERFSPHITIARVKSKPDKKIKEWFKIYENFEFGEEIINRVCLKRSILTPEGPIYETVYELILK